MKPVYVAVALKSDATPWWQFLIAVLVVGLIAWGIIMTVVGSRETKIRGPALTGTARVLRVRTLGAIGDPLQGGQRAVSRIRLQVEVPGHEPYEATARQTFRPGAYGVIETGGTVAVLVDSTNPQRVRIDLGQPITHWQVQSPSAPPEVVAGLADQIAAAFGNQFQQPIPVGPPPTPAEQAHEYKQNSGPILSAADLLASGQRVPAVLKSFAPTGTTPRSLGRIPSKREYVDAPHYLLSVDLHFPNMAPMTGQAVQPVPLSEVPTLSIGLPLRCAVDPADPTHRFVVDWGDTAH
jgi:hypothetical protein